MESEASEAASEEIEVLCEDLLGNLPALLLRL